ncbi:outer membrane protein assembly factor BamB family protein [Actinomadura rudentiformis]|uniref:PQQ-binding-like beta-propeller repeat protein n=1 Tax=Actinomadura rudentiformis TaxID=359158 RepID=A0A6H9YSP1_9ACTN|nr:PQQ-binding-like beta-propeller repeat protein [Actinomadura rudentiformis]KAB2349720.1 PQQ-binding-like beta-propeller repeat protein [Actinomadura rudentiformis]
MANTGVHGSSRVRVRWRFGENTRLTLGPVLAGDTVLVTDAEGVLHALDAASGCERWRHRHDAAAAGVAAGGRWVFVESDGDLWSHDRQTGEIADGAFSELNGRPVQVHGDVLLLQRSGRLGAADIPSMAEIFTTGEHVLNAPVAVAEGVVVAADRYEGNVSTGGLRAFDAATGRSLWSVESDDFEDAESEPVAIPPFHPVAAHGRVWVAAVRGSTWDDEEEWSRCELAGYDLRTGELSFRRAVGPAMGGPCCAVAVAGDLVFVVTAETDAPADYLTAFDTGASSLAVELTAVDVARSAVAWSQPLPDLPVGAPVVADDVVHTFTRDGTVLGHDVASGATRWSHVVDEPPGASVEREWGEGVTEEPPRLVSGAGLLFVQTATGLLALEPPQTS